MPNSHSVRTSVVIGGGLAGTSVAYALAKRGIEVSLIEKQATLAQGASGQAAIIAQPILHRQITQKMQLSLIGFSHLKHHLRQLEGQGHSIKQAKIGVLHLAHKEELQQRFDQSLATLKEHGLAFRKIDQAEQTQQVAGIRCAHGGVFFPEALWLSPKDLCQAHVSHSNIQLILTRQALSYSYQEKNRIWQVRDSKKRHICSADCLILACAWESQNFADLRQLPLRRVRGQSFFLPSTAISQQLKCIVTYDGYIIPNTLSQSNSCLIGATFEEWNHKQESMDIQNSLLCRKLLARLPGLKDILPQDIEELCKTMPTRVGFRTASPNRLPICGPLPNKNKGLYISTAYGSHGLLFSLLGAELIAQHICQEKTPIGIGPELSASLSPSRYLPAD